MGLKDIKGVKIPKRDTDNYEVFHLYCFRAKRDKLVKFLHKKIDAKKHYPIPMHLQKPSKKLGKYKKEIFHLLKTMC